MSKKTFFPADAIRVYPLDKILTNRWFVRWKMPNGKRRELTVPCFDNVKDRERAANEIIKLIERNPINPLEKPAFQASTIKTEKLYEIILSRVGRLEKKTIQSYRSHVNNLDKFCAEKKLRFLTPDVAEKFIAYIRDKGISDVTINKHLLTFSILFKLLIAKKEIRKNPFKDIERPRGHSETRGYFRINQIAQIKTQIEIHLPQLLPTCEYLYYLLCRPKELRLIKIEDVDFDNWTIKIKWNVGKTTGSFKYNRFAVIPNALKEKMIAQNIQNYPPNYYLLGNKGVPSETMVSINYWSSNFTKIIRKMGFSKEYTLYSIKNTGAIQFYKAGIGLIEIQRQIGHKDINTTMIYFKSMGVDDFENVRKNVPSF